MTTTLLLCSPWEPVIPRLGLLRGCGLKTPGQMSPAQESDGDPRVGMGRFERPTSWPRTRRATKLRYTPFHGSGGWSGRLYRFRHPTSGGDPTAGH